MENVTDKIYSAVKPEMNPKEALEARKNIMAQLEKESTEKTGFRSDIVSFYQGSEYWIYRYKKYTDVRLVFAPEQHIAFLAATQIILLFPVTIWIWQFLEFMKMINHLNQIII